VVFVCALALTALTVLASVSGWLEKEAWGRPISVRRVVSKGAVPKVELPDVEQIWADGERNPFGGAAIAIDAVGKANISPPPVPSLQPEMPPAPAVRPVDLLTGGTR
jgi:hypothetical protein